MPQSSVYENKAEPQPLACSRRPDFQRPHTERSLVCIRERNQLLLGAKQLSSFSAVKCGVFHCNKGSCPIGTSRDSDQQAGWAQQPLSWVRCRDCTSAKGSGGAPGFPAAALSNAWPLVPEPFWYNITQEVDTRWQDGMHTREGCCSSASPTSSSGLLRELRNSCQALAFA